MMTSKRKRKAINESENDGNQNVSKSKFDKLRQKLVSTNGDVIKRIPRLRKLLFDSKDDADFVRYLEASLDDELIGVLLRHYNATESYNDRAIFDSLYVIERTYHADLKKVGPLVWGEKSKENYDNLRQLGRTLHARLTSDQVLDYLDPRMMWYSLLNFSDAPLAFRRGLPEKIYDARFILRLLVTVLEPGVDVSSRKFIESNALSFAFAATGLHGTTCRALAYVVIHRYLAYLSDLNAEIFPEKTLFVYLIRLFRNSIEQSNQKIPNAQVPKIIWRKGSGSLN